MRHRDGCLHLLPPSFSFLVTPRRSSGRFSPPRFRFAGPGSRPLLGASPSSHVSVKKATIRATFERPPQGTALPNPKRERRPRRSRADRGDRPRKTPALTCDAPSRFQRRLQARETRRVPTEPPMKRLCCGSGPTGAHLQDSCRFSQWARLDPSALGKARAGSRKINVLLPPGTM
jgi:hypothetical protein